MEMMYIYEITDFSGNIIECSEGQLEWIDIDKMYELPMWEGDKEYLPLLKEHKPYFKMKIVYSNKIFVKAEHLS